MKSIIEPTLKGDVFSLGVYSEGNPYGINEDLIFSYPCISTGNGDWKIEKGWSFDPFIKDKIDLTVKELGEEKSAIENLL